MEYNTDFQKMFDVILEVAERVAKKRVQKSIQRKGMVLVCPILYSGTWRTQRPHQFHGTIQGWDWSVAIPKT